MFRILKNKFKDKQRTQIIVFMIKIDITLFIARLQTNKLDKIVKVIARVLKKYLTSFCDIEFLIGFLLFNFQAICLDQVFIKKLWDFINQF